MKRFMAGIVTVDKSLYVMAGIILACMIILTLFDVVLRNFRPSYYRINGIYTIWGVYRIRILDSLWHVARCQVIVDIITEKLSPGKKRIVEIITRCMGIIIFLFIAYNFFVYGIDVRHTGERTASFKIPYYPFSFALSFSFLLQSFTIFCDLIKTVKGADNE